MDVGVNRKDLREYKQRSIKYLLTAQGIYNLFPVLPVFALAIVYFHIDPTFFLLCDMYGMEYVDKWRNHFFHLYLFQGLLRCVFIIVFFISVSTRYFGFVLILDCCRVNAYDYILTLMCSKSRHLTSLTIYRLFSQIRLCHFILNEFYRVFYCMYMTFCQYSAVLFFWVSIVAAGRVPWFIWLCLPISGAQIAFGACIYIGSSFEGHFVSRNIVTRSRVESESKFTRKLWRATPKLEMNCAHYFKVSRVTVLITMHLILTNLSSLIFLNEDRNAVHVILSY